MYLKIIIWDSLHFFKKERSLEALLSTQMLMLFTQFFFVWHTGFELFTEAYVTKSLQVQVASGFITT